MKIAVLVPQQHGFFFNMLILGLPFCAVGLVLLFRFRPSLFLTLTVAFQLSSEERSSDAKEMELVYFSSIKELSL